MWFFCILLPYFAYLGSLSLKISDFLLITLDLCSDRPWDPVNDVYQFEHEYVIHTQKRHKTPKLRVNSLSSLNKNAEKKKLLIPCTVEESDSSCQGRRRESDSSDYKGKFRQPMKDTVHCMCCPLHPSRKGTKLYLDYLYLLRLHNFYVGRFEPLPSDFTKPRKCSCPPDSVAVKFSVESKH